MLTIFMDNIITDNASFFFSNNSKKYIDPEILKRRHVKHTQIFAEVGISLVLQQAWTLMSVLEEKREII